MYSLFLKNFFMLLIFDLIYILVFLYMLSVSKQLILFNFNKNKVWLICTWSTKYQKTMRFQYLVQLLYFIHNKYLLEQKKILKLEIFFIPPKIFEFLFQLSFLYFFANQIV